MEELDPKNFLPHLAAFQDDKNLPCAIILEYIPGMRDFDTITYTPERWEKAVDGLKMIHEAAILHADLYPKNAMITPENPERVLWIDFDRAESYKLGHLTQKQKEWMNFELECAVDLGNCLVCFLLIFSSTSLFSSTLTLFIGTG